jgi:hypothetical protein
MRVASVVSGWGGGPHHPVLSERQAGRCSDWREIRLQSPGPKAARASLACSGQSGMIPAEGVPPTRRFKVGRCQRDRIAERKGGRLLS